MGVKMRKRAISVEKKVYFFLKKIRKSILEQSGKWIEQFLSYVQAALKAGAKMQYPMGSSDPCPVWRSMLKNSCYNEQNEWGEADAHEMTYYKFGGSTQNLKNIASKQMLEIATFSLGLQSRPIKVRIYLLKWELLNLCHPLT